MKWEKNSVRAKQGYALLTLTEKSQTESVFTSHLKRPEVKSHTEEDREVETDEK